jgi:hypothetical protein
VKEKNCFLFSISKLREGFFCCFEKAKIFISNLKVSFFSGWGEFSSLGNWGIMVGFFLSSLYAAINNTKA